MIKEVKLNLNLAKADLELKLFVNFARQMDDLLQTDLEILLL